MTVEEFIIMVILSKSSSNEPLTRIHLHLTKPSLRQATKHLKQEVGPICVLSYA